MNLKGVAIGILAVVLWLMPHPVKGQVEPTIEGAFYYAWYGGEDDHWQQGHQWTSTMGEYQSGQQQVIDAHIDQMVYADVDVGVYSWWGRGSPTDDRFRAHLDRAEVKGFKWAVYYELDWANQRGSWALKQDFNYLKSRYFNHPAYLHIDGKPVVFVYMIENGGCGAVSKWNSVKVQYGLYVNMFDVPGWWTCNVMDSWHRYDPKQRHTEVYLGNQVYSMTASAGFWASGGSEVLSRDFTEWESAVAGMHFYTPQWRLTYFNEFGEGSNIEPSNARCEVVMCADYLQTLHEYQ